MHGDSKTVPLFSAKESEKVDTYKAQKENKCSENLEVVQVSKEKACNETVPRKDSSKIRVLGRCKDIRADKGVAGSKRNGTEKALEKVVFIKGDRKIESYQE